MVNAEADVMDSHNVDVDVCWFLFWFLFSPFHSFWQDDVRGLVMVAWQHSSLEWCGMGLNLNSKLETVSIAEPLQNRQHARLMLSTLERKGKREG